MKSFHSISAGLITASIAISGHAAFSGQLDKPCDGPFLPFRVTANNSC